MNGPSKALDTLFVIFRFVAFSSNLLLSLFDLIT